MSYTHGQVEVLMGTGLTFDTAADLATWTPGYVPFVIKAVALVFTTAVTGASGTVKLDKRPTAGSDSGRGDGDVADIDYTTTTGAQGKVVYQEVDVEIVPGEEVVAQCTDASATTGDGNIVLFGHYRWEVPGNNTDMAENTA